MARQAPNFNPDVSLTPVATPVSTYSGPPSDNMMSQLARGLSDLNPELNKYIADERQSYNEKEFQAGQDAYLKAKSDLKSAVDKGAIQPGYSPAFQRGYQQGQLRVQGMDYDQQLRTAYSTSEAANSTDPHAFTNFVQDFTSKYMQDNVTKGGFDPVDIQHSFMPAMDSAQRSLYSFHADQQAKTVEDNWQANSQNEISTTIDNAKANGFTPEQIGGAVNTVIAKQMANGWHDKSQYNANVVKLITDKAVGSGDTSLLDVMQHIPTGPGGTLGNTTIARNAALEATQRIQNIKRQNQQWDWAQQDHAWSAQAHQWAAQEHAHTQADWGMEQTAGTLMRAMIAHAIQDPTYDFTKQAVQLSGMDRDGSHARAFEGFRQSILNAKAEGADHPDVVTSLYTDMLNHPQTFDPMKIVTAYNQGGIGKKTFTGMLDDQRRIAENGGSPLLKSPLYTTLKNGVAKAFAGDPDSFDVTKVASTTNALMDFQRHAMNYLAQHKDNLDETAFYDDAQKYHDKIIKNLVEQEAPKPKAGQKPAQQQQAKPKNAFTQPGMAQP